MICEQRVIYVYGKQGSYSLSLLWKVRFDFGVAKNCHDMQTKSDLYTATSEQGPFSLSLLMIASVGTKMSCSHKGFERLAKTIIENQFSSYVVTPLVTGPGKVSRRKAGSTAVSIVHISSWW